MRPNAHCGGTGVSAATRFGKFLTRKALVTWRKVSRPGSHRDLLYRRRTFFRLGVSFVLTRHGPMYLSSCLKCTTCDAQRGDERSLKSRCVISVDR
jgi:hypothetical protein